MARRIRTRSAYGWLMGGFGKGFVSGVLGTAAVALAISLLSDDPDGGGAENLILDTPNVERRILALPTAAPVDGVVAKLGPPSSELETEGRRFLFYPVFSGLWKLAFADGELESRSREYANRSAQFGGDALDRKVRALSIGASIEAVEGQLGKPETREWFEGSTDEFEALWYGQWKLVFTEGKLENRSRY